MPCTKIAEINQAHKISPLTIGMYDDASQNLHIHTYHTYHTYTVIYLVILLEELILTALQIEIFIGLYCPLGLPDKSSLILLFRRWIGPLLEL